MAAAQPVAESLAAGAAAAAGLAQLGIEPSLLPWALAGGGAFVLLGSTMGRWRAIACGFFAVPLGCVVGHWAAVRWLGGDADVMRILTLFCAAGGASAVRGFIATAESRSAGLWGAAADKLPGGDK